MPIDTDVTERAPPRRGKPRAERVLLRVHCPGADEIARLVLSRSALTLGRVAEAGAWQVPDGRVSRKHAEIVSEKDETWVRDLSTNGTFVNGERVGERVLADGDVIRVGDSLIVFRHEPADARDARIESLVGHAPSMRALRADIALAAPSETSVLVLGESGTGKELVARALHDRADRSGPFVAINCSAIPESLAESHLFGHAAGSFTGAKAEHPGVLQRAHGGTLFLDEIGEMPLSLQPKLLRAIEERSVIPVGGTRAIPARARIVAATHRDLDQRVAAGTFRGDLFARLAGLVMHTPPLRARREDVLPLLRVFLRDGPPLAPDLAEALLVHPFPFNVRELSKLAEELALRGAGAERLELEMIESRLALPGRDDDAPPPPRASASASAPPAPRDAPTRDELEALLATHGRNVSALARATGRSRRQVRRYLEQHGIDVADA